MENLNYCPWTTWEPSTLQWCERQLCSWIREPSNTWSNLAFVVVGIWVLFHAKGEQNRHLRLLGYFGICIGLMSGFYHATGTFVGEVLDFSSMYFTSTYFVCAAGARMWHWDYKKLRIIAFSVVGVSIALLVAFKKIGIEIFAIQFNSALLIEYLLWKKSTIKTNYRGILFSLACFVVAYAVWWTDKLKILCHPDNHFITGHAIWHALNAIAIGGMYFYYKQFSLAKDHHSEPKNV